MTSEDLTIDPAASSGRVVAAGGARFELEPHNCFACGSLNAGGLQLVLHTGGERCWTELMLPERFEGWQGIAHGGIVCTILDEVMAWALIDHDAWGVTARLNVEFKAPVRVGSRIRGEGRVVEVRRRLMRTEGRLVEVESGALLATAEALFVAAPEEKKRELKERYGLRMVPEPIDGSGSLESVDTPR